MSVSSLLLSLGAKYKDDVITFDSDKAAEVSNRLGRIASEIEMSAKQIEGPISETVPVWTGLASEKFFEEVSAVLAETKEIASRTEENKRRFDIAAEKLINAENAIGTDINSLSSDNVFIN
jgi:uncharacterized protein YukE